MNYQIVPLSTDNLDALVHLYRVVFKNKVTHRFVSQKFDSTYLGPSHFGHIALFKGEPVAFHGAVPFRMSYRSDIQISAQYGDAMTSSKHTGRGLFTDLGHRTDQQLEEAGIRFVWGFPNQNSEYGYVNKMAWQSKERMIGFKVNTTSHIAATKLVHKVTNQFESKMVADLDKYRIQNYLNGSIAAENRVVTTLRDRDFYRYKSFGGNFSVKIKEVSFWLKLHSGILIGDVDAPDRDSFVKGLVELKKLAARNLISPIILQSSPETKITRWMQGLADEVFTSWMVGYKNFSSDFPLEKLKLTFGDLDTF